MTRRRVPRLAFFLPSLAGGGAERVVLSLVTGFSERGYPTDLILARAEGPYLRDVPPGVRMIDLDASRVLRALLPLGRYLRRERPAALVGALDHANLVAMAAGHLPGLDTRIVITIHNTISRVTGGTTDRRVRVMPWLFGRFGSWADAIVAVSHGAADDFALVTGIARDRVQVIYNPVVTPALAHAAAAAPAHIWFEDAAHPVVLGVGRLTPQKNFPLLVEAFARVRRVNPAARLVILGDGPERAALEAQVAALGLAGSVAFPGFVANPYACMARAAVFALSSDWEGLPTVLIECLALGTPVVSTDCESGPREILRGGALGSLVPVGDAEAFSEAIARQLRASRQPIDADTVRPFTRDVVLDQFEQVLGIHG